MRSSRPDGEARIVPGSTAILRGGALDIRTDMPAGTSGYLLDLTSKGRGEMSVGGAALACHPGDAILVPPGVPCSYRRAPGSAQWLHRWIHFRPRDAWAHLLAWPLPAGHRVGRLRLASSPTRVEIEALVADIDAAHRGGDAVSEELALNLLERLLIRCRDAASGNPRGPRDIRVIAACRLIADTLARDVGLADIARYVELSTSRLIHLFRDETGVSILRWREDKRIVVARHLLHSTTLPVSAVAAHVGYEDRLYFSRVFRKRVGMSPTEFRDARGRGESRRRGA